MNSDDLFAQAMEKVQSLSHQKPRMINTKNRKHDILRNLEDKSPIQQHSMETHQAHPQRTEPWLLQSNGVSTKDIHKLSKTSISHHLDLHGLNQNEATLALTRFFHTALASHTRRVSIIHGKGNHSKGSSVLKILTYQWLAHGAFSSHILAATAGAQSKGGASHVLLRKTVTIQLTSD